MSDQETTVASLREKMALFVKERDWEQFHGPKNLSMALATEVGELMEHFLWIDDPGSREVRNDPIKMQAVGEEIADVTGLILALCNSLQMDLSQAIHDKMAKNAIKYPVDRCKGNYRVSS